MAELTAEQRRERQRVYRRASEKRCRSRKKSEGQCVTCGKKKDNSAFLCPECSKKASFRTANHQRNKIEQGLCRNCTKRRSTEDMPRTDGQMCLECRVKAVVRARVGTGLVKSHFRELLQMLYDQNFRCFYTGDPIMPGEYDELRSASIDHIVPMARGGSNDLSNLCWVSWMVNRMKTNMTHEEFVSRCAVIAGRFTSE